MSNFLKGFIVHKLIKPAPEPGTSKPSTSRDLVAESVDPTNPEHGSLWRYLGFMGNTTPRKALEKVYGPELDEVILWAQDRLKRYTAPQEVGFPSWTPEDLQREVPIWQWDRLPGRMVSRYFPTFKYLLMAKRPSKGYRENVEGTWDLETIIFPELAKSRTERERALPEQWKHDRLDSLLHELTHAYLRPKSDYSEYTKHLLQDFPEETLGSPLEIDPRLAELKRKYYQATGRIVDTPEEAERAFQWLSGLFTKYNYEAHQTLHQRYGSKLSDAEKSTLAMDYAEAKLFLESPSFPDLLYLYLYYRAWVGDDPFNPETEKRKRLWEIILQRMTQLAQNRPKTNWEYA